MKSRKAKKMAKELSTDIGIRVTAVTKGNTVATTKACVIHQMTLSNVKRIYWDGARIKKKSFIKNHMA